MSSHVQYAIESAAIAKIHKVV